MPAMTYTYTGRLTDLGLNILTENVPRLTVRPERSAMSTDGPVSTKHVEVNVNPATGEFALDLIASADMSPPTRYVLELVLFDQAGDGTPIQGWDFWTFAAVVGGGNIAEMGDAPITSWWIGPPWPDRGPLGSPSGLYLDTITGDFGWKDGA